MFHRIVLVGSPRRTDVIEDMLTDEFMPQAAANVCVCVYQNIFYSSGGGN